MSFGGNFNPDVFLKDDVLTVKGPSAPLDGGVLVSRQVALQQPPSADEHGSTQYVYGPADLASDRTAELKLEADDSLKATRPKPVFTEGDALAIGTETHFVGHPDHPEVPATFVTQTWAEVVTIKPGA